MKNLNLYLLFLLIGLWSCHADKTPTERWIAGAPAIAQPTAIHPDGITVIPNGRLIAPYGNTVRVAPHPYGLALSPDGTFAITANSGTRPFSISILSGIHDNDIQVRQIPEGPDNDEGLLEAVFMGLAITPDNKQVYVAGGTANKIFKFDVENGTKIDSIDCTSGPRTNGYIGDMVLSEDGSTLYALDQIGFQMLIIDTHNNTITHRIPTGRYPFGICLSPDGQSAYVANVGVFEYQELKFTDTTRTGTAQLDYPPSGYNSEAMREGYQTDSLTIPGLGDPNAPEAFSVWKIDLSDRPQVSRKVKTGFLVGEPVEGIPAVGGASPNSIVATDKYAFVSNGNNDCISAVDFTTGEVVKNIFLKPDPRVSQLRGAIPFGLALAPDQQRLYVAASGINAVAVIDVPTLEVIGYIPVGWFPSKLAVTPDGRQLIVANAKGYGSGPNGGRDYEVGPEGTYIGNLMKGSVTIMDIPSDDQLPELTKRTINNNFRFEPADTGAVAARNGHPIPLYPGASSSPIKYIVFISKENRTYDEVFGQLKDGNGDPSLARYGLNQSFANNAGTDRIQSADIMVNHLALAKRFALSDNFYVDSDHSADGHRWLVNTYPNEWVETSVAASYGGKRRRQSGSTAPGNLALVGATGAIYPEDYNEAGSIWDHFDRNDISFFNFGFGMELAPSFSDSTMKYTGVKYVVNFPVPGPLYDHSSAQYATYNMAIPDQFRADQFIKEFEEKWMGEGKTMPQVLTIILPNDHGAGDRPHAGYPFKESYMADNDLALGRIVEFLSKTPYWENMAIFVTEDDSQGGVDHVDAHRSLLMLYSPYAKKDYVGHQHYSFGSIFKTFWHILGVPYLNQYDAGATDLADLFTTEPDFTPYQAFPVDSRIFDPQKALDPFDEQFDWQALIETPELDNVEDFLEEHE
ncbi:MAG: bifunctional YncE family protein/alkaline phosphatase family protein [Saprospiraceae bacterium]